MVDLQLMHKHIAKDSRVQGGRAVISGTRVPVSDIVYYHKQGKDVHEILEFFPHLTLAQVHDALAYYYDNENSPLGAIHQIKFLVLHLSPKWRIFGIGNFGLKFLVLHPEISNNQKEIDEEIEEYQRG